MLGSSARILVRKPRASDADALATVFRESWQLAYRGIIPHLHLECMIRRRGPVWWKRNIRGDDGLLVLELGREVVGYATFGLSRTRRRIPHAQGEIYELYLAPTHQGVGLGEHLFEASRHMLDIRGLKGLVVWALEENQAALDFYWRRGGRPIAKSEDIIGGARLTKIGYLWD